MKHLKSGRKKNSWNKITSLAINKVPNLINWAGLFTKNSLISLGYEVETKIFSNSMKESIINQIEGQHGQEIRQKWENFDPSKIDKVSEVYKLSMEL